MSVKAKVSIVAVLVAGIAVVGREPARRGRRSRAPTTSRSTPSRAAPARCSAPATSGRPPTSTSARPTTSTSSARAATTATSISPTRSSGSTWTSAASGTPTRAPGMPTNWADVTFDKKTHGAAARGDRQDHRTSSSPSSGRRSPRARTRSRGRTTRTLAREDGERTGRDLARQERDEPARQERAGRDQEPAVLVLDLERGIRPRLLEASLRRRRRQPQVLLEKRNGFTITWTAKGDITPAAKASASRRSRVDVEGGRPRPPASFPVDC